MYHGMCQLQAIMSGAVLVRNLGEPKRQTKISKQAPKWAQWLIPNTFHNIRVFMIRTNGHACGFCTMGTWIFNTMVRSGRPKKTCPLYLCKRTKRRQKRSYENNYSFSIHQSSLVYLVVLKALPVHNFWMDFQIQKKYPSFLIPGECTWQNQPSSAHSLALRQGQ